MIYNFSEIKQQNDFVENKLLSFKEEYLKSQMSEEQLAELRKKITDAKKANRRKQLKTAIQKLAVTAAAFLVSFMVLPNTSASMAHAMGQIPLLGQLVNVVTFRNYEYETDRNAADIQVPEITIENPSASNQESDIMPANLTRTTNEINSEIQEITDNLVKEFEAQLAADNGYQNVVVKSEILTTAPEYFTLKLICYQGAGSGYQWNYYYTIDMNTGNRLQLKDIFRDDADYITAISENIKEQMKAQMAANSSMQYWLDSEVSEWDFNEISADASFYLNANGNVVIGFDEGEVAPMYMGPVEFEIPSDVLKDIRNPEP